MHLPEEIFTGYWQGGHIQGIALDQENGFLYCSFTTQLVKLDLNGNLIGWVSGLAGHLGCLCRNPVNGKIYGSLEYKNDAIGQHILQRQGRTEPIPDAFYIAIFDGDKITRPNMDAERDGVMTAVCLHEVAQDYTAAWSRDGKEVRHRYGCSGIDGLSFGPAFGPGDPAAPWDLYVTYGIYRDVDRSDNDHQVLLRYNVSGWDAYAMPLCQSSMHHSGPPAPDGKYFAFTGNTTYGVQNLEYDPTTGNWLMAVYPGTKPEYDNLPMYALDGSAAPVEQELRGVGERGLVLQLAPLPCAYPDGTTGMIALGGGAYYFSEHAHHPEKGFSSTIRRFRMP